MRDELDGWCDDCADDTRHHVTDFDAGWTRAVCTGCGEAHWFPTAP